MGCPSGASAVEASRPSSLPAGGQERHVRVTKFSRTLRPVAWLFSG